jgi:hypothetical protein
MTEEEYRLFLEKDPWDEVEGWVEYTWEQWSDGDYEDRYCYFPSHKTAAAYFAAHSIRNFSEY